MQLGKYSPVGQQAGMDLFGLECNSWGHLAGQHGMASKEKA